MLVVPPSAPANQRVNLDETNEFQISLEMTPFAFFTETGGSHIVSNSLEWHGGLNGTTSIPLTGYDSNNSQPLHI